MCVAESRAPGTIGSRTDGDPESLISSVLAGPSGTPVALRVSTAVVESVVAPLTLDSFVRAFIYDPQARAFSAQAQELVNRGEQTLEQAAELVNQQRNALLREVRATRNSPLGRAFSEWRKPSNRLPTVSDLVERYRARNPTATRADVLGTIIRGSGRTNKWINRVATGFRFAGPALVAVDVVYAGYLVSQAAPEEQGRVAAQQTGRVAGGLAGGWAGAQLGCEAGAAIGVWFEGVGAIPGCLVGAALGGIGFGIGGSTAGEYAGNQIYEWMTMAVDWIAPAPA